MSRFLVLFAICCAVVAALIGFGAYENEDGFGWLALSLAAYFGADALENR